MQIVYKLIFYGVLLLTAQYGITHLELSRVPSGEIKQEAMTLRLELFTSDIENTVRFYQTVLGFELLPSNNANYQPMRKGAVVLGIGSLDSLSEDHHFNPTRPETQFGYGVEIVLEVEDVRLAYDKAQMAGAQLEGELGERPWGLSDFRFVDPNGYYIRVTSRP